MIFNNVVVTWGAIMYYGTTSPAGAGTALDRRTIVSWKDMITTNWLLSVKDNNQLVAIWKDNNQNGCYRALWLLNKITTNEEDNNQST